MEELYKQYADDLLSSKGITATPEQRNALLDHIDRAVNESLLGALPAEQLAKLDLANKTNTVDDDMIERLLNEAGIDPTGIIKKALDDYKNKFLQEVK